jgi:hypothetical protein
MRGKPPFLYGDFASRTHVPMASACSCGTETYPPCHGIQARFRAGMPSQNPTLRTVTRSETAPANGPRRPPELKRVQLPSDL